MALYFVDYDLRKQHDYQKLYDALQALGAIRVLESLWALKHSNTNCTQVRDHLKQYMDKDDGVIVSEVVNWASFNVLATPPQ